MRLAGLGGRVLIGMLADRYGAKRLLIATLALQSVAIASYTQVNAVSTSFLNW